MISNARLVWLYKVAEGCVFSILVFTRIKHAKYIARSFLTESIRRRFETETYIKLEALKQGLIVDACDAMLWSICA